MKYSAPFAIVFALVLTLAPQAEAQTSPFRLGLSGGAAASSLGGSSVQVGNSTWGGMVGAFGTYRPARQTSIGFEVNWVQKGGDNVAFTQGETQDIQLQYIEFPLTIGYVNSSSGWDTGLYIGISLGFQISCKVKGSSSGSSTDCEDTTLSNPNSMDWSIPFGFAFARNLGGSSLGLDIRYSLGLSDIFENSAARNRSWQFRAIWAVPIDG